MPPAARLTDMHTCPMFNGPVPHVGGPIAGPGAPTVLTGNLPQARVSDMLVCVGPPDVIVKGSMTVLVMGMPAARMGDMTAHGGSIILGFPTVMIGDAGGGGGGGGGGGVMMPRVGAPGQTGEASADAQFTNQVDAVTTTRTSSQTQALTTSNAFPQPEAQAETLKESARTGAPFTETCKQTPPS
ncbi:MULTISPECIES: PAAR domain-containing protein [Asticcacaulis]|uniref:PAAR domain-containing protein n=1 Tax=Asticcacaulis TaxID=76890 RepID=UPI001AE35FB9|nr:MULTISPECIES: PAAR domain-containing protein [Asticcacaulis]MBP2161050.1 putative Zn-binding protein involved in type VI secretion [Asticcacaulis solisilvae]MDR6802095.1 putative Zn-binding protein involved in type VI secretion [Asticcacaulis sp. BE141]